MDLEELNDVAIGAAKKLGVDDAVALSSRSGESMIRFANNSVTVVNRVEESELAVYLAKNRRRALASTSNLGPAAVRKFVGDLFASMKGLPESDYVPLPVRPTRYAPSRQGFDRRLESLEAELPDMARSAIDAAGAAGGKRSAGVISAGKGTVAILTTAGTRGVDSRTAITLNIRSFAEKEASGHGLSCSSTLAGFDPEEAGTRAGEGAKTMRNASEPEAGRYSVLLSPTVASNLVEPVASAASAFSVDAGTSYPQTSWARRWRPARSASLTTASPKEGSGGESSTTRGQGRDPTGSSREACWRATFTTSPRQENGRSRAPETPASSRLIPGTSRWGPETPGTRRWCVR